MSAAAVQVPNSNDGHDAVPVPDRHDWNACGVDSPIVVVDASLLVIRDTDSLVLDLPNTD